MNCPVCNRASSVALSICPRCGAMKNDSVREEHIVKVSSRLKPLNNEMKEKSSALNNFKQQTAVSGSSVSSEPKHHTTEITIKMTSPTLVDFQHKDEAIPEWRLKVQNAVRRRQGKTEATAETVSLPSVQQKLQGETATEVVGLSNKSKKILATSGANALKAEAVIETLPSKQKHSALNSALQRIEESRQKFLIEEKPAVPPTILEPPANNKHPFYLASKQAEVVPAAVKASVNPPVKPKLAPPLKLDSEPLDTNKLPPLPPEIKSSFGFAQRLINNFVGAAKAEKIEHKEEAKAAEIVETEEIIEEADDYAPLSIRFNAGLFDLIIGSFLSLILIAPFAISGGTWFTFGGVSAFLATTAIVMFIYLTTTIGFYGRTFGMRLFSLEVVDIEGEEYPTMHQAAVSSAVYLLSLFFCGVGFLTVFFNEESRAAHDLVSKTIVVKEF